MRTRILILLLALALLAPPPAGSAAGPNSAVDLAPVGQIGGAAYVVAAQGPYAYVNEGPNLLVLDVTQPLTPTVAGRMPLAEPLTAIAVAGDYAYLADLSTGLRVVDVSDPAQPRLIATSPVAGGAEGIAIQGERAYLACGAAGLLILDVSVPVSPVVLGAYDTPGHAHNVAVQGAYACVADGPGGLRIIDVADPAHPHEAGSFQADAGSGGDDAFDVALGEHNGKPYAYVACDDAGLQYVDISDPARPRYAGYRHLQDCYGVTLAGDQAYVNTGERGGLCVYGINGGQDSGCIWKLGRIGNVCVSGDYALVADRTAGLLIIHVPTLSTWSQTMVSYQPPVVAAQVQTVGGFAYVRSLAYRNGSERYYFAAVNVAQPAAPRFVGEFNFWPPIMDAVNATQPAATRLVDEFFSSNTASAIRVAGSRAYLAAGASLMILSLDDPARPTTIGVFEGEGYCQFQDADIAGHYAYALDWMTATGLRVIAVDDPARPRQVGVAEWLPDPRAIRVAGRYAYIACGRGRANPTWQGGLRIVDIADPTRPRLLGAVETPSDALALEVAGRYAYVADRDGGLRIIDVADPAHPRELGAYDTPGQVQGLCLAGQAAYLACGAEGVLALDVSDPARPTLLGSYDTWGTASDVDTAGGLLYVADGEGGLLILRAAALAQALIGPEGGELDSPSDRTHYAFPAGAFTGAATVTHAALPPAVPLPATGERVSIGHAFEVTAVYSDTGQPAALAPGRALTVSVQYEAGELGAVIEDTLALYTWDGAGWVRAPASRVDTAAQVVTAAPGRLGLFAVLGETRRLYLPSVRAAGPKEVR